MLASAVMEAVSSQEFKGNHLSLSYGPAPQTGSVIGMAFFVQHELQIPVAQGQKDLLWGMDVPLIQLLVQPHQIQTRPF